MEFIMVPPSGKKCSLLAITSRPRRQVVLLALLATTLLGQRITTPKEQFGNNIGDDYFLANYTQLTAYWQKLAKESNRMKLVSIGKTAEDRDQWMSILTSPENHKRLDRYREIARKLALAEGVSEDEARKLAAEGKAVVWIDGGLHATEVLGAHQLMEFVYQMVSRNDPETLRFLNDVIILAVHANPDGMELVSNSYMKEKEPTRRRTNIPRLYQKYIGHDNNRDLYLASQAESINMARVLFREWFPQIMYNHHQSGPAGAVLFAPPFREPYSFQFDPLIRTGISLVGATMHQRFAAENKPGATMMDGAAYSNWFNGGLRSTTCYHNMIGLLTETIGNPTPMEIPFVPDRMLAKSSFPFPIQPQRWHFRQSIEYSMTANRAVLDVASRYRETFLFNIWRMGMNSIERGSRDNWTMTPKRLASLEAEIAKEVKPPEEPEGDDRGRLQVPNIPKKFYDMTRDPALRDARAYIIPSSQADFPTATKFVNALIKNGITVHRATAKFTAAGKEYPAGSYLVKAAQAFRPHIVDMFEPQDYPNDFRFPGGAPIPPYDNAGWTLAYQMGIAFDRALQAVEGPFEKINDITAPPPGRVVSSAGAAGYTFSHAQNDSFVIANRLLKSGRDVYWLKDGKGTMYVPGAVPADFAQTGVSFTGVSKPSGDALKLRPVRIGLWDRYGGSMPSGWVRWILEQFEFPHQVVFPQELDSGNLKSKFDVLVFVTGAISGGRGGGGGGNQAVDPEFSHMAGNVTPDRTIPKLKEFLERGGTVITIGSSTVLARHLGVPIADALTEKTPNGPRLLPRDKFYVPGSVVSMRVDNSNPLAWGMPERADFFFDNSPAFRLLPEATARGTKAVAWFDSPAPLRSGWAWGQHYLEGAAGVIEAPVGEGKLYLYGPEVTFRAQPHGTFKLFFNGIFLGTAIAARL
jgi:hypothetical protein